MLCTETLGPLSSSIYTFALICGVNFLCPRWGWREEPTPLSLLSTLFVVVRFSLQQIRLLFISRQIETREIFLVDKSVSRTVLNTYHWYDQSCLNIFQCENFFVSYHDI